MIRVYLATKNPGKVREIASILSGIASVLAPPSEWIPPEETGSTYLENARLKAHSLARFVNAPALADDSGIEADALGAKPGVHSARFAGPNATDEQNLSELISAVRDSPERGARYHCVAVLAFPDGTDEFAEGTVEGTLIATPRGSGGFGYDPIFVPAGYDKTMAELSSKDKDAISHRGKAFRALIPAVQAGGGSGVGSTGA